MKPQRRLRWSQMLSTLRGVPLPGPYRLLRLGRQYATVSNPQTLIEKIVQKYAVDLPTGAKVRAGDYLMIRPEHV